MTRYFPTDTVTRSCDGTCKTPKTQYQNSCTTTPLLPLHVPELAGNYHTYPVFARTPFNFLASTDLHGSVFTYVGWCFVLAPTYLDKGKTEALLLTAWYG